MSYYLTDHCSGGSRISQRRGHQSQKLHNGTKNLLILNTANDKPKHAIHVMVLFTQQYIFRHRFPKTEGLTEEVMRKLKTSLRVCVQCITIRIIGRNLGAGEMFSVNPPSPDLVCPRGAYEIRNPVFSHLLCDG